MPGLGGLTPFEVQILDLFYELYQHDGSKLFAYSAGVIASSGRNTFGSSWPGSDVQNGIVIQYPLLNRFLGRLQARGCLQRRDQQEDMTGTWGYWELTPEGCELLGIQVLTL